MTPHLIMGIDDRIDEWGESQPWRIVMVGAGLAGGRVQCLMALPGGRRYVSPPRHPLYGDLTLIGDGASQQIGRIVERAKALGATEVHLDERHRSGTIGRTLIWNGIEPRGHDVPDGELRDPFSIGGEAGNQIAFIEDTLRSRK